MVGTFEELKKYAEGKPHIKAVIDGLGIANQQDMEARYAELLDGFDAAMIDNGAHPIRVRCGRQLADAFWNIQQECKGLPRLQIEGLRAGLQALSEEAMLFVGLLDLLVAGVPHEQSQKPAPRTASSGSGKTHGGNGQVAR